MEPSGNVTQPMYDIVDMDFQFYHLKYNPFIRKFPELLFWSQGFHVAWDHLVTSINQHQKFVVILGQARLGKTVLIHTYRTHAETQDMTLIDQLDVTRPLRHVLGDLAQLCGLDSVADDIQDLIYTLQQFFTEADTQGRRTVLAIDEAHRLSAPALVNLCQLSDLFQSPSRPLLPIVLFGRPPLAQHCTQPELQPLSAAVATSTPLDPLTPEQSLAYIHHHLRLAATQTSPIFSKRALQLIVDHAQGIPKVINIMCSDILMAGMLEGEKPISFHTAQDVIGHVDQKRRSPLLRWGLAGAAGCLLAVGLWSLLPSTTPDRSEPPPAVSTQPPPARLQKQEVPKIPRPQAAVPKAAPVASPPVPVQPLNETPSTALAPRAPRPALVETYDPALDASLAPQASMPTAAGPSTVSTPEAPDPATLTPAAAAPQSSLVTPLNASAPSLLLDGMLQASLPVVDPPRPAPSPVDNVGLAAATDGENDVHARLVCVMPRTGGQRGSDIVLMDHKDNGVHRLIADGAQNMSPVLSPNGKWLAYTSYRDGAPNVYLRHLASGKEEQLTSGPWLALPGTWSPNSRYLALSQSLEGNNDIFLYDIRRKRLRRLTRMALS